MRISSALWMLGTGLGEMYELERAERICCECIAFLDEYDIVSLYTRLVALRSSTLQRTLGRRCRARAGGARTDAGAISRIRR